MKKLITCASLCLSLGMALALANAEDKTTSSESAPSGQQAGMADPSNPEPNRVGDETTQGNTSMRSTESTETKTSKTCTDSSGTTYHQGKPGFKECVKTMEKKHSEQMGGQSGSTSRSGSNTSTEQSSQ